MNKDLKYCKGCNKEKPIDEFYKHKDKNGKYYYSSSYCKNCTINRHQEYLKQYKIQHQDNLKKYRDKYYQNNKEQKIEYQKKYYQKHKEEKAQYDKKYKQINKTKRNNNENLLYKTDKMYKLKKQLRNCIYNSFKKKNYYKKEHTKSIIGCEYNFFISHLLQTYKNNYGIEWDGVEPVHIDHIIPLATTNDEQGIIRLCHYTNLQLLKAKDNLVKSSKLNYNRGD